MYVPGTALLVGAGASWLVANTSFDPITAATWTDRGTILAILAALFISWAVMLKYIASLHKTHLNATVAAIQENTGVTRQMVDLLRAQNKFNQEVANKAITDRLYPQPARTRVHSNRVRVPEEPKHPLPSVEPE